MPRKMTLEARGSGKRPLTPPSLSSKISLVLE